MPSLVEIGPVVLEKKMKMWKVYRLTDGQTDRQTDDGRQVIRKAHLSFQLRWAKNISHDFFVYLVWSWLSFIHKYTNSDSTVHWATTDRKSHTQSTISLPSNHYLTALIFLQYFIPFQQTNFILIEINFAKLSSKIWWIYSTLLNFNPPLLLSKWAISSILISVPTSRF